MKEVAYWGIALLGTTEFSRQGFVYPIIIIITIDNLVSNISRFIWNA